MIYNGTEILTAVKQITVRQIVLAAIVVAVPGGMLLSVVVAKAWRA